MDPNLLVQVWAFLLTVALPWVWLRNRELLKMSLGIFDAAKDGEVTEEEFQARVDEAKKVLFKTGPLRLWG